MSIESKNICTTHKVVSDNLYPLDLSDLPDLESYESMKEKMVSPVDTFKVSNDIPMNIKCNKTWLSEPTVVNTFKIPMSMFIEYVNLFSKGSATFSKDAELIYAIPPMDNNSHIISNEAVNIGGNYSSRLPLTTQIKPLPTIDTKTLPKRTPKHPNKIYKDITEKKDGKALTISEREDIKESEMYSRHFTFGPEYMNKGYTDLEPEDIFDQNMLQKLNMYSDTGSYSRNVGYNTSVSAAQGAYIDHMISTERMIEYLNDSDTMYKLMKNNTRYAGLLVPQAELITITERRPRSEYINAKNKNVNPVLDPYLDKVIDCTKGPTVLDITMPTIRVSKKHIISNTIAGLVLLTIVRIVRNVRNVS